MKHRLYTKFLFAYLIFALLSFLLIAFFSRELTEGYLQRLAGERLYTEISLLAEEYSHPGPDSPQTKEAEEIRCQAVAETLEGRIWMIDRQGVILFDSQGQKELFLIPDFDPTEGGKTQYFVSDFYGLFSEVQLIAYAPIVGNYQITSYLFLFLPKSTALAGTDSILNLIYITGLILFLFSLIFLLIFHFIVYRPLSQITLAAKNYAAGDLSYRCGISTEDEMGYLSQTLNYMASELEKTEEYQKRFISNISHDFRSPLTTIRGYLEALIDGTIPPELYEKYLGRVIGETDRLTKLTQNILTLQTVNSKGTYLEWSDFDINQVIKDMAATFEGICKPNGISFDLIFSERTLMVHGDLGKIQQVLSNLIDNAIKFSYPDSVIRIETSARYDKAFISVKDHGIGIPMECQKKIWERFYKTDLSRGKDKKGTGLGLSIVKEIIQAHEENINVISTVGAGSEFLFTLSLSSNT